MNIIYVDILEGKMKWNCIFLYCFSRLVYEFFCTNKGSIFVKNYNFDQKNIRFDSLNIFI